MDRVCRCYHLQGILVPLNSAWIESLKLEQTRGFSLDNPFWVKATPSLSAPSLWVSAIKKPPQRAQGHMLKSAHPVASDQVCPRGMSRADADICVQEKKRVSLPKRTHSLSYLWVSRTETRDLIWTSRDPRRGTATTSSRSGRVAMPSGPLNTSRLCYTSDFIVSGPVVLIITACGFITAWLISKK